MISPSVYVGGLQYEPEVSLNESQAPQQVHDTCLLARVRAEAGNHHLVVAMTGHAVPCPAVTQARIIGISSLHEISRSLDWTSHCTCSHCSPCHAPHPQEPDASVVSSVHGRCSGGDKNAIPFHEIKNSLHHARSDRNPTFRRMVAMRL